MKCPIHGQEMMIRNEGGEDHYLYLRFECPHPECHHWWTGIKQRDLIEGWRKRPPVVEDDYHLNLPRGKEVPLSSLPKVRKLTPEERKEYLDKPRRISLISGDQGDLFHDRVKEEDRK